ncbi:MAG: dephospho-CoA kinase [Peptostreptococcus porci]|uniref:dephospho-CoA kinase n=1 Tax=Peptostreptococcus porci TaxID=2652282 RepID=UPI002A762BCE|nr:dephospho-CoA kinase [Peptostreptococcus porci]MDY2793843.1 dephospho-CoA kinase [Peptostreptococcus porci]MDY5479613.1 dephospho-CoA kinase [Peptostreptococcus porci]
MLVLGLTGNIGCGKSTVSSRFKEFGIDVIDADLLTREIYKHSDVIEELRKVFPDAIRIVGNQMIVDRKTLGKLVFDDSKKLKQLNSITHKKINELIDDRIETSCSDIVVVDAALLFETDMQGKFDKVITVYCDERVQLERVIQRDNLSCEDAKKRIDSQLSQNVKVSKSDFSIDNSGGIDELNKSIENLMEQIKIWKLEIGGNWFEEK